ncbi:MAG: outer membrane protein assembly factor BamA [Rhodospirillales bacterium]|nr:MAG: outer membrane protein assembly factor BamA [Rhodospirillales bacterium]
MIRRGSLLLWLLGVSIALAWPLPASGQLAPVIREIVVEGAQRIDPETVRSYLLVREGDVFDPARIDRSLKSLFATGLFADVAMVRDGDRLIVRLAENPIINRVAFEGNRAIDNDVLEAEIGLRPRVIYTRTRVQSDVRRILTLYRRAGRFAATVEPKIIQLPENRVDLVFEIDEGPRTLVESIRFVGNEHFSDSRLRSVIRTREAAWWRLLTTDDTYDPDRLALDQELLRRFYLSRGYADFRVISAVAELTPDRRDFFITFTVDEGERYRFGTVEVVTTLPDLDPDDLLREIRFSSGDWYNALALERTVDTLADSVGDRGFAFVDVRPRVARNREELTIDVLFEIDEGPRVFVERIDISGNVRTLDRVIRREFRLVEGDPFNVSRLRRSQQRIRDLDFFQSVEIDQLPGSAPDRAVINVEVEEKSTGSITLGAGFSTTSGAIGDVTIRERNLLGRGQDLSARLVIAQRDSQINVSFTEPYFLGRQISAGADVFRISTDRQDESSFDEKSIGGAVRFGYPVTEHLSQSWRYSLRQTTIENVPSDASIFIREAEGDTIISEVFQALTYDRRDSRIRPREGYFGRWGIGVAGLGGDVRYMRNQVDGAYFLPLFEESVFGLSASAGYVYGLGQDVRLFERFFVGGDNLRGFETAGIGPRDLSTDDALGGEWFYTVSAEVAFPLGLPEELPIRGRLFADAGSAGGISPSSPVVADTSSIRVAVGAGLTWDSPFGPIGLDFGFPVIKEDFDKTQTLRVNFGARF